MTDTTTEMNALQTQIYNSIAALLEDKISVTATTPLTGNDSPLDSMKLVELCLNLEEMAADLGFTFNWATNAAISDSHSIFKTAGTLANEFIAQMEGRS